MSQSDEQFISVERVTTRDGFVQWALFAQLNAPQSVLSVEFEPWVELQVSRFTGSPQSSAEVYLAKIHRPVLNQKKVVGAAFSKWQDGAVEVKAIAIDRSQGVDGSAILRQLLRKIQLQCYRQGVTRVRVLLDLRTAAGLMLSRSDYAPYQLDTTRQELSYEKKLSRMYTGDPTDWAAASEWFLRELFQYELEPPGWRDGKTVEARWSAARFSLIRPSRTGIQVPLPVANVPHALALVLHTSTDVKNFDVILDQVGFADEDMLYLFIPEKSEKFYGHNRAVFTRQDVEGLLQEFYVADLPDDPLPESERRVVNAITHQRWGMPLSEKPPALMVDITQDNFRRLLLNWLDKEDPKEGIRFLGTRTGLSLRPGDSLLFYVWDFGRDEGGAIGAVAEVVKVIDHGPDSEPTEHDVEFSGFDSVISARAYVRRKQRWTTIAFKNLKVADEQSLLSYAALMKDHLKIAETDDDVSICHRHWPGEDLGYTYLSTDQVNGIQSAVTFTDVHPQSVWVNVGSKEVAIDEYLRQIDEPCAARALAWQTYSPRSVEHPPMSAAAIHDFFRQFETRREMELVEAMLSGVEFWNRARMLDVFDELLAGIRGFVPPEKEIVCVPWGGQYDSSGHLLYALNSSHIRTNHLREILDGEVPFDPRRTVLLFFDDVLATGWQSSLILNQYMGTWDPRTLHETHVARLTPAQIRRLSEYEVHFAYIYSHADNEARFIKEASARNIRVGGVHSAFDMAARSGLSHNLFGSRSDATERLRALRGCMQRIGGLLLEGKAQREAWSEEDTIRNSLGYGGLEQLVVFEHNVPTATVTALWKSGYVDGRKWTPLFPRKSGGKIPTLDDYLDHRYPNLDADSYDHILRTFKQRSYSVYQANVVMERLLAARQTRSRSSLSDVIRDFDALIDSEPPRLV